MDTRRTGSSALLLALACTGDKGLDTAVEDDDTEVAGETGDTGTDAPAWDPRFDPVAEAFQAELDASGAPGVAVAIMEGGEIVFSAGFGSRDPELSADETPMEGSTLLRIGSVTKMITAAATLTEVDSGALSLEQPIVEVLPDLDFLLGESWAPAIELGHLLTHQGGFYDWTPLDYGESDTLLATIAYEVFDDYLWLMVDPGTFWNYSNANYSLAGLVGQQSSGQFYRDLVDTRVLDPLGMDRTVFLAEEVEADGDYASAMTTDWTGKTTQIIRADPDTYDDGWSRPAGFAWSSAEEMLLFADFLMKGDEAVLSAELQQAMTSPQIDTEQFLGLEHYGYGLIVNEGFFVGDQWFSDTLISHGGAIPGYSASLYILPEQDLAMVILSNADASYFGESVAASLLELADLSEATIPEFWPDFTNFDEYTGSYADPWNVGDFVVTTDGSALQVSMPDLDALDIPYDTELVPYVQDNFLFNCNGAQLLITFIRDDSGEVTHWRNRYFVGERVDEEEDSGESEEESTEVPLPLRPTSPVSRGVEGLMQRLLWHEPIPAMILRAAKSRN